MARKDKYSVRRCRTAREFERAVCKQGGEIVNGGRHSKFHVSNATVPYPNHSGDLATGTRYGIIKALLAVGLFLLIVACIVVAGSSLVAG